VEGSRTQLDFLVDANGELGVNFVGRFEHLGRDFTTVCELVGVPDRGLRHENKSDRGPYQQYYTAETREMVARAFKPDIDYFGYAFENPPIVACRDAFQASGTAASEAVKVP
jgi:hypothetical protein